MLNQLEQNIVESFRLAKSDIIKMQNSINLLSHNQEHIMKLLHDIKEHGSGIKSQPVTAEDSATKEIVRFDPILVKDEEIKDMQLSMLQMQEILATIGKGQNELIRMINEAKEKEIRLCERIDELDQKLASKARAKPRVVRKIVRIKSKPKIKIVRKIVRIRSRPKVKIINRAARRKFIASKKGKVLHSVNCPFSKNIKPKMRIIFKTKAKALNIGYKPCECLKKVV